MYEPESPEQAASYAEVITALGAPRYVARREESVARATFEAEEDAPIVRLCNLCLLAMRNGTRTHLRITLERIELWMAGEWHVALTLVPSVRAWAHEEAMWRLKQMALLVEGPPRGGELNFNQLKLYYGEENYLDFDVCSFRTADGAPVVVAAALPTPEHGIQNMYELCYEACLQIDRGELDEAEAKLARASATAAILFGADFVVHHLRREQGRLLMARGDLAAAHDMLAELHARAEALGDSAVICHTSLDLGVLARLRGDFALAATLIRRAIALSGPEESSPAWAAETQLELARALDLQGQHAHATALLERAMELSSRATDPTDPTKRAVAEELATRRKRAAPYR